MAEPEEELTQREGTDEAEAATREERERTPGRGAGTEALRALVRDVLAEELERYWERRFGRQP